MSASSVAAPMEPLPGGSEISQRHPLVIYRDDEQLYAAVAEQLAGPLRSGDSVVMVATAEHLAGFAASLAEAGAPVDALRTSGHYVELDADELLAHVLVDGSVDGRRLVPLVEEFEAAARATGHRLLVVSELAPLLWARGLAVAALEMEAVGSHLAGLYDVELICAYPDEAFSEVDTASYPTVCAHHFEVANRTEVPGETVRGELAASHRGREHPDVSEGHRAAVGRMTRAELGARQLDAVHAAVVATDLDGVVQTWNATAERFHGWSAAEAIGRYLWEVTVPVEQQPAARTAFLAAVEHGSWEGELDGYHRTGTTFPGHVRNHVIRDETGVPVGVIGVALDRSEQLAKEQALARNNTWLRTITDWMGEGLCTLDADGRIAYVNPAGEQLMDTPASTAIGGSFIDRLLPLQDDDPGELGSRRAPTDRVGGVAGEVGEARLLRADGADVPIEYVATSLPITQDGQASGWVVTFRDITHRLAQQQQLQTDAEHGHWMTRIQDALDHDRFVLHAQPIVNLATGRTIQHELLIRLDDPVEGIISPGAFLPTAERYGLVTSIDRWVIAQAIDLAAAGHPVELNLSARSFSDPALPYLIHQYLDETGTDPGLLVFELTETALVDNDEAAAQFARRIHEMGCKLALDDFGTGYGAFTYLKHLPVDLLKIDVEFVRDAVNEPASRHVISAVVSLARDFGLLTIAEGVEDQATLDLLAELGVDQAQGYHFARPAPLDQTLLQQTPDPHAEE